MNLWKWKRKQKLAAPSRFYGDGGTIHGNTSLDVEVCDGRVVSVWFRCQQLPFRQLEVDSRRASDMEASHVEVLRLTGVEILDA